MESKRSSPQQRPSRAVRAVRAGLAVVISLAAVASLATGCLDRPVAPQEPNTSNVFVDQSVRAAIDRIDLLFMVDNSASMQDKQILLSQAVPVLLGRLLNPPCIDPVSLQPTETQPGNPNVDCPVGSAREFPPVPDVHIAVVSSSMGGHGNPDFCVGAMEDDKGHLIDAAMRPGADLPATYQNSGFLNWDNRVKGDPRKPDPAGTSDLAQLGADFTKIITAVGEDGCGYEASLESWYRFLIDPRPPASIGQAGGETVRSPDLDNVILTQRKAFLRPDSLVAIIMLSDENDCSVADYGYGWLASETKIDKGTERCASNPNDPCCTYCGYEESPAGCPDLGSDPGCNQEQKKDDATNVRCWDQQRRFGIDFLYPTSRYSTGLDSVELCPDSDFRDADCQCRQARKLGKSCSPGKPIRNPLYTNLQISEQTLVPAEREPGLVFLAGIVGVPWQDLATKETVAEPGLLKYKQASELDWTLFYGEARTKENPLGKKPTDVLMWEDTVARTGDKHPVTGSSPAPANAGPGANPINGHEWNPVNNEDLQYACIFSLEPILGGVTRDCNIINKQTCDCFDPTDGLQTVNARLKPLCQQADGTYSSIQVNAKAYPGLRQLEVLRFYGDNSIVASICPKVLDQNLDKSNANYGYNPAVGAIIDRLKEKLGGRCLPRKLSVNTETGELPCQVVEALSEDRYNLAGGCTAMDGRIAVDASKPADAKLDAAVRGALQRAKKCGEGTTVDCNAFLLCRIEQLGGQQLTDCQQLENPSDNIFGYCYVADSDGQSIGNPTLLANCPDSERRLLRFVGKNVPAQGATTFIACAGDTFNRATSTTQN